jgi:ornithine cyclodeaminase/alanine dehydrogenase-like protein (mu-crystallin family)
VLEKEGIQADLFELCRAEKKGRSGNMQVTLFKSVGTAIEDLAAAMLVWRALQTGPV